MTDTTTERERTRQQQLCALEAANAIRTDRARMRREISALPMEEGCDRLAEVLAAMPRSIRSLAVGELLLWPSHIQRRRVATWLAVAQCGESRKIGLLSARQRLLLAGLLREHVVGDPACDLTDLDRSILACLDMAPDGELTLGRDIAAEVGTPARLLGSRFASLMGRGYVVSEVAERRAKGWRTTEAWRAGVLPR